MTDKKRVSRSLKQLRRVKTWQLVCLLILSIFVAATFLRLNNVGMIERRTAVLDADAAGDSQVTQNRMYDLQRYVTAHMNTDMGTGVYLVSTYKRDAQTAYDAASKDSNPNGNIYKKAQEVCAPKFTRYSTAYLQCTLAELQKYPSSENLISSVNLPDPKMYLHVFVSPLWSPDFAGWSVVICIAIFTMIIARLVGVIILKLLLRRHKDNI